MTVIQSRKHGNSTHLSPETLLLVREELYQGGVHAGFRWLPREASNQWPFLVEFKDAVDLVHANGVVSKFTLDEFEHFCKLLVFWLRTSAEMGGVIFFGSFLHHIIERYRHAGTDNLINEQLVIRAGRSIRGITPIKSSNPELSNGMQFFNALNEPVAQSFSWRGRCLYWKAYTCAILDGTPPSDPIAFVNSDLRPSFLASGRNHIPNGFLRFDLGDAAYFVAVGMALGMKGAYPVCNKED